MLVRHVYDAWLKCLVDYTQTPDASRTRCHKDSCTVTPLLSPSTSKSGDPPRTAPPPSPGSLAAAKAVVASMKAHTDLLIKAATFGPVHKKNIRLVIKFNLRDYLITTWVPFFQRAYIVGNGVVLHVRGMPKLGGGGRVVVPSVKKIVQYATFERISMHKINEKLL